MQIEDSKLWDDGAGGYSEIHEYGIRVYQAAGEKDKQGE